MSHKYSSVKPVTDHPYPCEAYSEIGDDAVWISITLLQIFHSFFFSLAIVCCLKYGFFVQKFFALIDVLRFE